MLIIDQIISSEAIVAAGLYGEGVADARRMRTLYMVRVILCDNMRNGQGERCVEVNAGSCWTAKTKTNFELRDRNVRQDFEDRLGRLQARARLASQ